MEDTIFTQIVFEILKVKREYMPKKTIYTIGTSDRSLDDFVDILNTYGIKILVDVRRFPTSKFGHFKREFFEKEMERRGIEYHYLGKELGGYREKGYQEYIKTEDFKRGLDQLMEIASKDKTAIMCCERFAWRCHRRFIGYELIKRGWKVIHIVDEEKVWIPKERKMKKLDV